MNLTLAQIADFVGGTVGRDRPGLLVSGAATLRDAEPGEITFVENGKNRDGLTDCRASAVLVPVDFTLDGLPYVQVDDVRTAFAKIVTHFRPRYQTPAVGISRLAQISPTARLAGDVQVHPRVTIGEQVTIGAGTVIHPGVTIMAGCRIGEGVTIFPNAVLYDGTVVGARSIIHANAVLGAYGFGYESSAQGHKLSPQLGYVELGEDVEIGAGTTIDRGTFGATTIGDGTKIDNLVQIGHNCRIGRHNLMCSQVGIAGSCTTGDFVVMAGQVGVRDHVNIGTGAMIGAKSGVSEDLAGKQTYLGAPAQPARSQMQTLFALQRLPELIKQVRQLERQLNPDAASALPAQQKRSEAA